MLYDDEVPHRSQFRYTHYDVSRCHRTEIATVVPDQLESKVRFDITTKHFVKIAGWPGIPRPFYFQAGSNSVLVRQTGRP